MRKSKISTIQNHIRKEYEEILKRINESLQGFSKDHDELNTFLFHTEYGRMLREDMAGNVFKKAVENIVEFDPKDTHLKCSSNEEQVKLMRIINDSKFEEHIKKDFTLYITASRRTDKIVGISYQS